MLLRVIEKVLNEGEAQAHCDIPCGIYSTHQAGVAAETVEVMVGKILNPPTIDESDPQSVRNFHNAMTRFVMAKEEWAEICKKELLILWTDYFKDEHLAQVPDLHERIWRATKLASKNKREVSAEAAAALRTAVEQVTEVFKKTEGEGAKAYRQEWL